MSHVWNDDKLEQAKDILSEHSKEEFREAVEKIQKKLGVKVTASSLRSVFLKKKLGPPTSYCRVEEEVSEEDDTGFLVGMKAPKVTIATFATEEEAKALKALEQFGSRSAAAKSLGITDGALRDRVRRAIKRAASRGWAPEHDWVHPVPDGHRIKGNSTRYNGSGGVDQQWVKSERDSDDPPQFQPVPENFMIKKVSTLLDAQGKVRAQWLQAPKNEQTQWDEFWAACERNAKSYKGLASPVKAPVYADKETWTVYPLGDPHVGMLSWAKETGQDFDLQIAEEDLTRAIDLLVDGAPKSETAVLANVGDFFHAESDAQRTPTGGNKLDCDTRWAKITEVGFNIMRRLVDRLLAKHSRVYVVNVPGNHDPQMARMLSIWLKAVYEKEPRVEVVDNRNPYIYLKHGKNLIGFAHGDGAKPGDLPGIMAADRPADWGASEFRVWYTGHIHHQTKKEFPGCVIESFRTLAPRDYWHAWKGYRSGQSLSSITVHAEFGEITRSTVDIKMVRAFTAGAAKAKKH